MKIIQIFFLSLSLFSSASCLAVSPYELLRYNARFCKGDLKWVVYATLKPYTHKRCLKAALTKLEKKDSKLYNKFDHPYVADSKIRVIKEHRLETKEILIQAIESRLGGSKEKDPSLTNSTSFGRKLFVEDVASFCALMGNYKLLAEYKELNPKKVDFKTLNASFVLAQAKDIDLYSLFDEYRSLLIAFQKNKKMNPEKKKEVVMDLKKMRDVFLILLDNLVVLKKRMSQSEVKHYRKEQLVEQRNKVRNALVSIAGARRHVQHIEEAIKASNPDRQYEGAEIIGALAQDYPNFFYMLNLIRYTDLLSSGCLKN